MSRFTGTFCPQCGMPALRFSVIPMCTDGWEVLYNNCECCDYDSISGFRRIGSIPDEDGMVSVIFAKPVNLGDLGD